VGEVTPTQAILWGRCSEAAWLSVTASDPRGRQINARQPVNADSDYAGKVLLSNLDPDTAYQYRVWCTADKNSQGNDRNSVIGSFRTAPEAHAPRKVRIAWSGDLGGQNVCRDARLGYPIFVHVTQTSPDLFVALGDMIYADDPCLLTGRYGNQQVPGPPAPATRLEEFWAFWKYNRADPGFQRFLARTPSYAVWDDHETQNDAGPSHDTSVYLPQRHLLPVALRAFLDYNPIVPLADAPTRLYRSIRWGKHVELFLLDARQYRESNAQADDGPTPKSLLGAEQKRWLLEGLSQSDATWKGIVCSVPLSIPTGAPGRGHDGWANAEDPTGFERELLSLLDFLRKQPRANHLWITTDVHFSSVFRYAPFADTPEFQFYEIAVGPLNAGVFPHRAIDPTLSPQRLFHYPDKQPEEITTYEQARSAFSFGLLDVEEDGTLSARIVNGDGRVVYEQLVPMSSTPR
jgi:alkaline phosphatase D